MLYFASDFAREKRGRMREILAGIVNRIVHLWTLLVFSDGPAGWSCAREQQSCGSFESPRQRASRSQIKLAWSC